MSSHLLYLASQRCTVDAEFRKDRLTPVPFGFQYAIVQLPLKFVKQLIGFEKNKLKGPSAISLDAGSSCQKEKGVGMSDPSDGFNEHLTIITMASASSG